jgi:hypothetical protein
VLSNQNWNRRIASVADDLSTTVLFTSNVPPPRQKFEGPSFSIGRWSTDPSSLKGMSRNEESELHNNSM